MQVVQSDKEERVHRAAVIPGADPHARGRSLYYHYAAPAPFEKVVAFYEDHLSQRLGLSAADRPKLGEVTNEARSAYRERGARGDGGREPPMPEDCPPQASRAAGAADTEGPAHAAEPP